MMSADAPLLEVIIVAYGRYDLLTKCLRSLREHPPSDGRMRVHVVDNNSPDTTADSGQSEFPEVRLWRLSENTGFSTANNIAMRAVRAPYLLILNPDTELRAGVLDHMLSALAERPGVGMAGCRLEQENGTFDHAAKRSFPTPTAAAAHFLGTGRRLTGGRLAQYRATDTDERGVGDVDAINVFSMLVRRDALPAVGLFDEGYWLYMEDFDWCARLGKRLDRALRRPGRRAASQRRNRGQAPCTETKHRVPSRHGRYTVAMDQRAMSSWTSLCTPASE